MEIITNEYRVWSDGSEIHLEGTMRLPGSEAYAPIFSLMTEVLEKATSSVTMNVSNLEYLNSSGINMIAKFTIEVRKRGGVHLTVKGSQQIPWQTKSLGNLKKLLPESVVVT
ncbi:hypothetical protein KXR53_33375 [Inquilinus limosus]|uniref:slr1659 superfamily regulator n=1 Tax=Inquilinus limosus TaxID=171674 RepID=UPI003F14D4C1